MYLYSKPVCLFELIDNGSSLNFLFSTFVGSLSCSPSTTRIESSLLKGGRKCEVFCTKAGKLFGVLEGNV